jgi:large subunit ribosomal protein L3
MKQIVGRKMGMTQVFAKDGTNYPVTVIEVLPNVVIQVKTVAKDGYSAVQVGIEDAKESSLNNPQKGIWKKNNLAPKKYLFEIKCDDAESLAVGSEIKADVFQPGDIIDVVGTTKGHGYSGTIQRWNMKIGPKGHGASGPHRLQGSFANNGRTNNRVIPGKHMSGHYGNESCTIQNALIVDSNVEKGYILVRGGVPGAKYSFVTLKTAYKTAFGQKEVVKELHKVEKPVLKEEKVQEAPVNETTNAEVK